MKPILYIMVAVPGSGKSWYATNKLMRCSHMAYISRDKIRFSMVGDDERYFVHEKEVYKEYIKRIVDALNDGMDVIADATHITWASRHKLLTSIDKFYPIENIDVIPVIIHCSYEKLLERNNKREGRERVPESTIKRMYDHQSNPHKDKFNYLAFLEVDNN